MEMGGRRRLVPMAVQAIHGRVIGVHDYHRYRGAGGGQRVDVAAGVVAGSAEVVVGGEDVLPVHYRVAVRAGLRISLAAVCRRVDLDGMVD